MMHSLTQHALLQTGFRAFFLAASSYAVLAVLVWLSVFALGASWSMLGLTALSWHAHEMIFGYVLAVIAGFLLTAVRNWTGLPTARGGLLLVMVLLWMSARMTWLFGGTHALLFAALFDLLFWGLLSYNLLQAIVVSKSWAQLAVWSKLALFGLANLFFYLGALQNRADWMFVSLLAALFLVVGLLLMLGRRLIPFFIERASKEPVQLINRDWLDRLCLLLFVIFFVLLLWPGMQTWAAGVSLLLFGLHALRLSGWHCRSVWQTPLVWVLFLGYGFTALGFLLYALAEYSTIPLSMAIHAFAFGGMGLMTAGMMARVSLGHTGRDVYQPPHGLIWVFGALFVGAAVRVLMPWWLPAAYTAWIVLAQVLWVLAFAGLIWMYAPIWWLPRVDGKPG